MFEFSFTASPEERVFELAIGGVGRCLVIPQGWYKTAKVQVTVPKVGVGWVCAGVCRV